MRKRCGASIKEALLASKTYRKFSYAFRELTGLHILLCHLSSRFPERSLKVRVPVPPSSSAGILLVAYSRQSNGHSKRASAAAFKLLQVFANHLALMSSQVSLQPRNIDPPVIQRAKAYIEENYTTDLSLASMAKFLGVSRFYFCKLFKKATGRTLSAYVAQRRIDRAKRLLLNPTARISEIAFEVGFQSLTHFNRAFRRSSGHSPTEYRKDASRYPQ
jgi:AraC-like DNA-binding protein